MAEDRPIAISSSGHLGPDDVSRHTFATARRGFEPAEVRAFLEVVARELQAAHEREQQLRKELTEAEHRAQHPVLEESTLTAALGQETARVLQAAHDAAADLLKRAETDIAQRIAEVDHREAEFEVQAERAAAEQAAALQEEREQAHRQAQREVGAMVDTARAESDKMLEGARSECRSMVQQAQELRTRILTDLSNRRRVLHLQIEQLRAGRERLSEAIQEVRLSVDHIADDLFRAEDEARLAAEAAGRTAADSAVPDEHLELASEEMTAAQGSEVAVGAAPRESGPAEGEVPEDGGDAKSQDRTQQVDDLFARLRAGKPEQSQEANSDVADSGDSATAPADQTATQGAASKDAPTADPSETAPAQSGPQESEADPAAPGPEIAQAGSEEAGSEGGEPEGFGSEEVVSTGDPRPQELVRRDDLLGPVIAGLSRRIKRALQDDQNDILHRLRNEGGWKDTVLPDASQHMARYVEASSQMLQEAARAGAVFVGLSAETTEDVSALATELASELVGPLRRRLEEDGPSVDPNDDAALVEHVGAAFREWRGDRTERLAGDHATSAFSRAALAAMPGEATVRWIVDDLGAPCADCEDNALSDDVTPGEQFPTGHVHPPAHSGCRCLLMVTTAT